MSLTWNEANPPDLPPTGPIARISAVVRIALLVVLTLAGMVVVVLLRLIERAMPLRLSTRVVQVWGRLALGLAGVRMVRVGKPMHQGGGVVANHTNWMDIITLYAADGVTFVSKAEVGGWPVVGQIARLLGTVFVDRRPASAGHQAAAVASRLARGDRLCIFPEGTSTDGQRVLRFRSPLFAAFETPPDAPPLWVQPVSVIYHPPPGLPDAFYGWWGDMALAPHLMAVFALSPGNGGGSGVVEVIHHEPIKANAFPDRKALAQAAETAVRDGVIEALTRGRPQSRTTTAKAAR